MCANPPLICFPNAIWAFLWLTCPLSLNIPPFGASCHHVKVLCKLTNSSKSMLLLTVSSACIYLWRFCGSRKDSCVDAASTTSSAWVIGSLRSRGRHPLNDSVWMNYYLLPMLFCIALIWKNIRLCLFEASLHRFVFCISRLFILAHLRPRICSHAHLQPRKCFSTPIDDPDNVSPRSSTTQTMFPHAHLRPRQCFSTSTTQNISLFSV